MIANLYQTDFHKWATEQATLLRSRNLAALDIDNLIDEVEGMAKSEWRELESRLTVLLAHLLKWACQPDHRSNSWRATVKEQRFQIKKCLRQNPGLKPSLLDESVFPNNCPWSLPQVLDDGFWPNQ